MSAQLLDGKAVASQIRADLSDRISAVRERLGRPPGLTIVLVGDDPASEVYVRNKLSTAEESGMHVSLTRLGSDTSLATLLETVKALNDNADIDAILVQSPLPAALGSDAEQQIFDAISPGKDVDGFSPISAGYLAQNRAGFVPCTPAGVIEMLDRCNISVEGKRAVVIGRSEIVGKPMALLLLQRNATVTICHSRTKDLPGVCREADILVAAIGRAGFVTRDYIKPGAIVIDVGINRVTDSNVAKGLLASQPKRLAVFEKNGSILVGDVHPEAAEVAGQMTPVPGGVGPLTIAMLMANTVRAAELAADAKG
jgi:methylenetetrahydrofolate dehydrogenase (NADP+)/methenyltetrahydrofolate cyclohydrolase